MALASSDSETAMARDMTNMMIAPYTSRTGPPELMLVMSPDATPSQVLSRVKPMPRTDQTENLRVTVRYSVGDEGVCEVMPTGLAVTHICEPFGIAIFFAGCLIDLNVDLLLHLIEHDLYRTGDA